MDPTLSAPPVWSTAAFGAASGTSPTELSSLGRHVACCKACRGPMFHLRRMTEHMDGFVASRFVTCCLGLASALFCVDLLVRNW